MSKEAVRLFAEKIEQDEPLQELVRNAFETKDPNVNLADVGREHGFEFTEEEGLEVWNELQNEDELSDFALELISGGAPTDCSNSRGTELS